MRYAILCRSLAIFLLLLAAPAHAGIIGGTTAVSGGTYNGTPTTFAPNNDNVGTAGPNLGVVSSSSLSSNPLDVVFGIAQSGGTTEYAFTQTFTNQTSFTWGGVSLFLGLGVGGGFTQIPFDDGLDFDTPDKDPAPFSSAFLVNTHDPDFLLFLGGSTVAPGASLTLNYSIDIPDRDLIDPSAWTGPGYDMTLRFEAIPVPEPSAILLLGIALAFLRRSS